VLVFKYLFLFLIVLTSLHAHQSRENYISLSHDDQRVLLQCDIETDNFSKVLSIDDNSNGIVSWRELRANEKKICGYLLEHIWLTQGSKKLRFSLSDYEVYRRDDQSYLRLKLVSEAYDKTLNTFLHYDLFFDMDKMQRVFVSRKNIQKEAPQLLSPHQRQIAIIGGQEGMSHHFTSFFMEGLWHIWGGYDHLLFLLMLLLPSLIEKQKEHYRRCSSIRHVFYDILTIITLFSLAHSLTLSLSFFDIATVKPKIIEVLIIVSIMVTAVINITGVVIQRRNAMVFAFGLLHGFGFANALNEMALTPTNMALTLLGFNLGVETGQIIVVATVLPGMYLLAGYKHYHPWVIDLLSSLTLVVSSYWLYGLLST